MKPLLKHVTTPVLSRSRNPAPDFLPNLLRSRQITLNPWMCQRCRHGSQAVSTKEKSHRASRIDTSLRRPAFIAVQRPIFNQQYMRRVSSSAKEEGTSTGNGSDPLLRKDLPSQQESRRSHILKRFSHVMDNLQSNVFIAGQRLNDLTGYSAIEALKKDIEEQEKFVQSSRLALQEAKQAYSSAIAQRSASQREVNELLQRKHAWSAQDLERFTALYRSDHANEQEESAAQETLALAERTAEEASAKLTASILGRYHEEQIWSDKIRRASTWGTWGLMGVNVLLFLVFQVGVEPWRRKRLVKGFEDKVMEALEREGQAKSPVEEDAVTLRLAGQPAPVEDGEDIPAEDGNETVAEDGEKALVEDRREDHVMATDASTPDLVEVFLTNPANPTPVLADETGEATSKTSALMSTFDVYKEAFRDLFSERQVSLRRVDLTTLILEGTAAGAAIVIVLASLLRVR